MYVNLTLVETFHIHIIMVIMVFMVIIKVKMPSEKPLMEKIYFCSYCSVHLEQYHPSTYYVRKTFVIYVKWPHPH